MGNNVPNLNGYEDDEVEDTPQPRSRRDNNNKGGNRNAFFDDEKMRKPQFTNRPNTLPDERAAPVVQAQRLNNQQQQQPQKGNKPNPNASSPAANYVFTGHQLRVMGLLVLAAWLNDEGLRNQYNARLKKTVGDTTLLLPLFEQIIESVETGFALSKPAGIFSAGMYQKYLNGRKLDAKDIDRLNALYQSRYFNMDEPPGVTLERMLLDERLISSSNIVPLNLQDYIATAPALSITAKDITGVDLIVRSDYNDALQAHAQVIGMDNRFTAFLDEVYFHQYLTYNGKFITEWVLHDRYFRVTTEAVKIYTGGDNIHQCSIVMLD